MRSGSSRQATTPFVGSLSLLRNKPMLQPTAEARGAGMALALGDAGRFAAQVQVQVQAALADL